MKQIYFLCSVLALAGVVLLASCSDDNGLYFTQNEVIGDVVTGKQIRLEGNTLKVYTTEVGSVNVQGASGGITAVSSDERVATVRCVNDQPKQVIVNGVKEGSARIVVTDAKGTATSFVVVVTDVEQAWGTRTIITAGDEVRCMVEGVSHEDSLAIAKDARERFAGLKYVVKSRAYIPTEAYRMYIYDRTDKLLEKYAAVWNEVKQADATTFYFDLLSDYRVKEPLERLSISPQLGLERSVSRFYKKQYPKLKNVIIRQSVKFLKL